MALRIIPEAAADYSGAVLPAQQTMGAALMAIPGFLGAWDAASGNDMAGSSQRWSAVYGTGALQVVSSAPTAATRDARAVARLAVQTRLSVLSGAAMPDIANGVTVAMRAYLRPDGNAFAKMLDFGAPELFARPTLSPQQYQWKNAAGVTSNQIAVSAQIGWHTYVFRKDGTAAASLDDNGAILTFANGGALLGATQFSIGDGASNDTAALDIARLVILASGAPTANQVAVIKRWIG